MTGQIPRLPDSQKDWDDLLNQLHCGTQVHISAQKGNLQLRLFLDTEEDNTTYLTVVLGLFRFSPKTPALSDGQEFFELGGQRIMCGFDVWNEVYRPSGVPLLQKTVTDIACSVIVNAILDLSADVDAWQKDYLLLAAQLEQKTVDFDL